MRTWQEKIRAQARKEGVVRSILGRPRSLPELRSQKAHLRAWALRAAVNTPVQGSAADLVNLAMVRLCESEALAHLGYRLILQIHDEVLLEGPGESALEAAALVQELMEMQPLDLSLAFPVSVKCDRQWSMRESVIPPAEVLDDNFSAADKVYP